MDEIIVDRDQQWLDSLSTGQSSCLTRWFSRQQINIIRKYNPSLREMDFFKRMSTLSKPQFLENLREFQRQVGMRGEEMVALSGRIFTLEFKEENKKYLARLPPLHFATFAGMSLVWKRENGLIIFSYNR